jgi:DNA-binding Lrp family transcriptional regulator
MQDIGKKADRTTAVGAVQIFCGGVMSLLFGIISLFLRALGGLTDSPYPVLTTLFLSIITIGIILVLRGYVNYKVASRYRRVSAALEGDIGTPLSTIAQKLNLDENKLLKTLHKQTARGFWPKAFLDTEKKVFYPDYNPVHISTESGNQAVDEILRTANGFIHEMTIINRSIEDTDLNAHVDTLIDLAKQVYTYIEKNPDKSGLVRQLSNYFLPTAAGLLASYVELQSKAEKNDEVTEAMSKVTEVVSTIEEVFKKQLSSLYSEKAMDVSVEAEVLQNMADI